MEDVIKKQYILHYILKPDLTGPEELHKRRQMVNEKVETVGGEVEASVCQEGVRRLSYPIKKVEKGYFCETAFKLEPEGLLKLNQNLKPEHSLLRYFIECKDQTKKLPRRPSRVATFQKKILPLTEEGQEVMKSPRPRTEEKRERISVEELDKKLEEIMKNI